jgi:hypothetical protein
MVFSRKQLLHVSAFCIALALALTESALLAQTLPVSGGGTGATTAPTAISTLGLPVISVVSFGATGNGTTHRPPVTLLASSQRGLPSS